jgi:flagellar hook assembly protein FlgD
MSNVGNVTYSTPSAVAAAAEASSSTNTAGSNTIGGLTQQDFLQLMVAQFQASDPLADDSSGGGSSSDGGSSDYVNQLMSMTNLTTLQGLSSQQGLQMAQQLSGATATITTPENTTVTGVVTGTTISQGVVNVTIDGQSFPSTEITGLTPTPAATTPTTSN